jgi:hypothetical protein
VGRKWKGAVERLPLRDAAHQDTSVQDLVEAAPSCLTPDECWIDSPTNLNETEYLAAASAE